MKNFRILLFISILFISLMACNLSLPISPVQSAEEIYTAGAKTMVAELTGRADITQTQTSPETNTPFIFPSMPPTKELLPINTSEPTYTPSSAPSNTQTIPVVTSTKTLIPCNAVTFIKDVSIPDGSQLLAGSAFVKTWRLKNIGACSWNSAYSVVFISGEKMSGPDVFPLTAGVVAPGQVLDVSVNLLVPVSLGTKQGFWALRSPEGVIFSLSTGPFWVKIKSVSIIIPPPIVQHEVIASLVSSESGAIKSNNTMLSYPNIGDNEGNLTFQGFLSFDISTIPSTATIQKVEIDFTDFDKLGAPFGLGCLRMYKDNFGTLEIEDYFSGSPLGATARFCNDIDLNSVDNHLGMVTAVQEQLGHSRVKFRVQFNELSTDSDNVTDMVRLGSDIRLIITYLQ